MQAPTLMNLKVLLPFRIFAERTGIRASLRRPARARLDSCHTDSTALRRSRREF